MQDHPVAISETEIIYRQLRWLTLYYSELLKLEMPGMSAEEHAEVMRLRHLVHHHSFLHAQLLLDALILGLAAVFERPGWNTAAGESEKITLEHFVRKLPAPEKAKAEGLLKASRSSAGYADLLRARNNLLAHSNRELLMGYTEQPSAEAFPNLTLADIGTLLRQAREIALAAIDPWMDFSTPTFEGVDELFRVLRRVLRPTDGG